MRNRTLVESAAAKIQSYFVRERLLEHESAIEAYQKGGMVKAEIDGILAAEFVRRCWHRLLRHIRMRGTGFWEVRKMGRVEEKEGTWMEGSEAGFTREGWEGSEAGF